MLCMRLASLSGSGRRSPATADAPARDGASILEYPPKIMQGHYSLAAHLRVNMYNTYMHIHATHIHITHVYSWLSPMLSPYCSPQGRVARGGPVRRLIKSTSPYSRIKYDGGHHRDRSIHNTHT